MIKQSEIHCRTRGRGSYNITDEIINLVRDADVSTGICHLFLQHTSASLMLCENADPAVRRDLEAFMARLVPDGDPMFEHTSEGDDDMPAHVRTVLTQNSMSIPIRGSKCALGTWQGVYLWEHRKQSHTRSVIVTIYGE
jgi:secondary thiamine-phosphate synthase enzyme